MSRPGDNLPSFRSVQLDFAAHIRNPEVNPPPVDVEARRMQIYVDLFFNNIKGFLDGAFPVSRKVLGEERWHDLAREFVHLHNSESPYFLQISEEFLTFLFQRGLDDLPPFLLELCHYEWVELALDVAVAQAPPPFDPEGDLLGRLVLSDLVRPLVYTYPVHEIGPQHQPYEAPDSPTYLFVYRNVQELVRFKISNPVTHRLLELLVELDGRSALVQIADELAAGGRSVDREQLAVQGLQTLHQLHDAGIILGTRTA